MKIEFRDVSFSYGENSKKVLQDINLCLDQPGLVCIIGPNGVGKSTLVKCITKINTPSSGEIYLDDSPMSQMDYKEVAKHVGYVPPFSDDLFAMNVIDTILIGRYNHQKWKTSEEDLHRVNNVLELLGLEDLALRKFNQLSAGQHQKVAIARGLVEETDILVLDEPTSNLDVKHQIYVMEMLRALAKVSGKLIIMISHDLNLAVKYANQVIMMESPGIICGIGAPEEIVTKDNVERVYGVECDIIYHKGSPMVALGSAFLDSDL